MTTTWYPSNFLNGKDTANPYAVLILNQPINVNALSAVIQGAAVLVCADAGGDRLLHYDKTSGLKQRLPDAIVGDLDSITTEARSHYEAKGVKVVKRPSQYAPDFEKALKWTRDYWNERNSKESELDVVVLGGLGGRVDQGFSQIHHLYLVLRDKELLNGRIYLLSEQSLSFVLDQGMNEIHLDSYTFDQNVGIIPVLGLIQISTQGFEWDVQDWDTEIGGSQFSTSNHWRSDIVSVKVNGKSPLFTVELARRLAFDGP